MNKLTSDIKKESNLVNKSNSTGKKGKISVTKLSKKELDMDDHIHNNNMDKSLSNLEGKKKSNLSSLYKGVDRFWTFRISNYTSKDVKYLENLECTLKAIVRALQCQAEKGDEKGTKHLQGFLIFNKPQRGKAVKTALDNQGAHIERMISTKKANLDYTSKSDTFDKEANIFISKGIFDVKQGKKSELSTIIEKIKKGESMISAIEGNEETYVRNYNGLKNYENMIDKPRELTDPLEVEIYYGAAGTGKSFKVYNDNKKENIYQVPPSENSKWYPGYDNKKHSVVLYNDFNGSRMKRTTLLEITDIYPIQVEIKGAFTHFKPLKIILTSNDNPLNWYESDENKKWALIRRLTKILEFQYLTDDMEIDEDVEILKNKDGLEYIIIDRTKEIKDETFKQYKESIKKSKTKTKKIKQYNDLNLELDN